METSMFQLQPKLKEPLQIVFLLDNSYIFDTDAIEDLKKQLEVIDRYVFQKEYRQYVHIDVLYFDGFEVKSMSNQTVGSFSKCLMQQGLPKIGEGLMLALDKLETIIKTSAALKPWFFILHQGFKVGDIPWEKLSKLTNEKKIFFRGFVLNQTIKINAIIDNIVTLPYIRIKPGKMSDMFEYIFKLSQQRVALPEDQSIKLPPKEAVALWGDPIVK
jgi:uncharacterized protein YegL